MNEFVSYFPLAVEVAKKCIGFDLPSLNADEISPEVNRLVNNGLKRMFGESCPEVEVIEPLTANLKNTD